MMTEDNVVPIRPGGLPAYDVELIEVIAHMFGSGALPLRKMHVSARTLDSYIRQYGAPDRVSTGFEFPVYRWRLPELERRHLVVIDQGTKRIEFKDKPERF